MDAGADAALAGLASQRSGQNRPTKLFIGGLSRHTTTQHLREHFSRGGLVRVLDCVAMRQADGRPRGFGYVTLDSPDVVERILREPQVIDNRVVDVKPAVPDFKTGAGLLPPPPGRHEFPMAMTAPVPAPSLPLWHRPVSGWKDATRDMFCSSSPDLMQESSMDRMRGWAENRTAPRAPEPLDCLDLLMGRQQRPPIEQGIFVDAPDLPAHPGHQAAPGASGGLWAGAPEFVPMLPRAPAPLGRPARVPFGERTNTVEQPREEVVKPLMKAWFAGHDYCCEPVQQSDRASRPGSSTDHSQASSPVLPAQLPSVEDLGELPSVGSALHASGNCQRCNFYPKGRCQNGRDCSFCHFPHEKQRLSRQEKRERRASAQQAFEANSSSTGSAIEDAAGIAPAAPLRQAGLPPRSEWQLNAFPVLSSLSPCDAGMYSAPPGLEPPALRAAPGLEAERLRP